MRDFRSLLKDDDPQLTERLCEVCSQLANLAEELSAVQVAEKRARAQGYMGSLSETLGGRDRDAEYNALDLTCSLFEIKGQIQSLIEERELLKILLGVPDDIRALGGLHGRQ